MKCRHVGTRKGIFWSIPVSYPHQQFRLALRIFDGTIVNSSNNVKCAAHLNNGAAAERNSSTVHKILCLFPRLVPSHVEGSDEHTERVFVD